MVERPITDKQPIIWGVRDWPYRETGMRGFGLYPCGGLFVYKKVKTIYEK